MEKLKYFRHIIHFEIKKGTKGAGRPETFALCMGTTPSERARQENGFLILRRIILTLVTLHIQEDLQGFMSII